MKKILSLLIAGTLLFSLSACETIGSSSSGPNPASSNHSSSQETPPANSPSAAAESSSSLEESSSEGGSGEKSLVVYFSQTGTTQSIAAIIQEQTGADSIQLIPKQEYPEDYSALAPLAQEEQQNNTRPALDTDIGPLDQYDTIYLGYPIWWGDMPMVLYTFLEEYDLSGKTIAPFCTSGGSGLCDTVAAIQSLEPEAVVTNGLHVESSSVSQGENAVSRWLSELA